MLDPNFDPLELLRELSIEVVRLNERQFKVEQYLKELADQHANIAEHLYDQSTEINKLYLELGRRNNEL